MTEPTNDLEVLAAKLGELPHILHARLEPFGEDVYVIDADLRDAILAALRSIAAPKQDVPLGVALRQMVHVYRLRMGCFDVRDELANVLYALNTELREEDDFYPPAKPDAPAEPTGDAGALVEQCVMVCPQCQGEGFYADGLDEAACSTECTRCGSNGWIVDLAALRNQEHLKK